MTLSLPSGAVIDVTESTVLSKYIINDFKILSHSLGTYDITEANLYNDLSNIGRICYSCHFIRGAVVKGCLILLTSSTYTTNISLMCSPVCTSTVIGCTYDIPTGIYNIYVYDIEEEGTFSDQWAISSTNITITGLEPTYTSLEMTNPVSKCPVSMVTITTGTHDPLASKEPLVHLLSLLYLYICCIDDTQVNEVFIKIDGIVGGNEYDNINTSSHIIIS